MALGRGILMKNNGNVDIIGYVDADWAGNPMDKKSISGFYMFVGGNFVTCALKHRSRVSCDG
jgi:hypothetical protein